MSALLALALSAVLTTTADVRALASVDGRIWAGTTGGLVVDTGSDHPRVLTTRDGLPDGTVRALLSEATSVWVGTDRGAAEVDHRGRVRRVLAEGHRVQAFARHNGDLYLGAVDGLYRHKDGQLSRIGRIERITALISTPDGLYITTAGMYPHLWDGERLRRLRGDRFGWALVKEGRDVWMATARGLRRYRAGRLRWDALCRRSRALPVADVRGLVKAGPRITIGTYGGGLLTWNGRRWSPLPSQPAALREGRVQALHGVDGELIAGATDGIYTSDGYASGGDVSEAGTWRHHPRPGLRDASGLPDNDLTALAETSEGLWVGTFRHGLARIDASGAVAVFNEASGLIDNRINRLAVDGEGSLWVATDRGVMQRLGGQFHLRGLLDHHVFALGVVRGEVWAGASGDVYRFRKGAFALVEQPGARAQAIAEHRGRALLATAEGLAADGGDSWGLGTVDDGLPDEWVTAVASAGGRTYVGTYNAGVARIDESGRVELLHAALWVNAGAMAVLGTTLWVGTLDAGLWAHHEGGWQGWTTAEGLPDNDVTALLPDGAGGLWVATRGGLARLEPRQRTRAAGHAGGSVRGQQGTRAAGCAGG